MMEDRSKSSVVDVLATGVRSVLQGVWRESKRAIRARRGHYATSPATTACQRTGWREADG
jgi:hypothetical protein